MPASGLLLSNTNLQRNIHGPVKIDVLSSNDFVRVAHLDHRPALHESLRNSFGTRAKIVSTKAKLMALDLLPQKG